MRYKYSVLVNSCDDYQDIWDSFFYILRYNWSGELPNIYLNTETKSYSCAEIKVKTLNNPSVKYWGERLLKCIKQIEDEYILMMLEDFLFESPVHTEKIEGAIHMLETDKRIAGIQLIPQGECVSSQYSERNFVKRKRFGQFIIAAGPTIWRKKDLILLTQGKDSPWEWEYFGSYRTWLSGMRFFCWCNRSNPIFLYDVEHGGAIHRGKWVGNKVRELEKKYDIKIITDNREIEDDWMKDLGTHITQPKYKRIKSILRNRIKMIKELFYGIKLRFVRGREI